MIIRISDMYPDETLEIRVKDSSTQGQTVKSVEIQLQETAKQPAKALGPHGDGDPPYRRRVNF